MNWGAGLPSGDRGFGSWGRVVWKLGCGGGRGDSLTTEITEDTEGRCGEWNVAGGEGWYGVGGDGSVFQGLEMGGGWFSKGFGNVLSPFEGSGWGGLMVAVLAF